MNPTTTHAAEAAAPDRRAGEKGEAILAAEPTVDAATTPTNAAPTGSPSMVDLIERHRAAEATLVAVLEAGEEAHDDDATIAASAKCERASAAETAALFDMMGAVPVTMADATARADYVLAYVRAPSGWFDNLTAAWFLLVVSHASPSVRDRLADLAREAQRVGADVPVDRDLADLQAASA